ncbi:uncharacterized protein A1O5_09220 [Cladophialophora psammophila CBS 110553]|uniref:Uncharacterized protein n=1 Tax=Cladophialophora psammophila CBS 110553 TaxID=1182543 RepID=W9WJ00_9EURO|nr:uncharacterized protein A1O5_09220 [Cladophialophora psammophila CBS 110553]EXJ67873.1 hypothetical protein A1O5_09220 [Cladophialophora psammophila CBS 110553]
MCCAPQYLRYTHIQIVGQDDPSMLRKWRLSRAARLIRLRSTLRSRPLLAALVRTLHVPDPNIPIYLVNGTPNPEYDTYLCTLASVVMECPNLEALTGFVAFYNHTFDRLTHALSTRLKLRQHVWVIAENEDVSIRSQIQLPPGLLDGHQTYQFELYHQRWKRLETLLLCSPGGVGVIEHELFIRVLHSLPALRSLCISSFDEDDFHDVTLLSLPPWVRTLRLEECLGITDAGLMQWAASPNAAQIERLSLLHQNITSLLTLTKIFASLGRLRKFMILQTDVVPCLPKEAGLVLFQPVLASKSLRFLHWDILCQSPEASNCTNYFHDAGRQMPNMHLALSISSNGFPSLRHLRAPRDISPPGVLQSVCQLMEEDNVLPGDSLLYQPQDLARSNCLLAARMRAQSIAHQTAAEGMNSVLPHALRHSVATGWSPELDPAQKSNGEIAMPAFNFWEPVASYAPSQSRDMSPTDLPTVHEPVSPISPNTYPFTPLAPDDSIISPITAEREERDWLGGDPDKEVTVGPQRTNAPLEQMAHRESICWAMPGPNRRGGSMCVCGEWGGQNVEERRCGISPPPRSPLRPAPGVISLASSVRGNIHVRNFPEPQVMDRKWTQISSGATRASPPARPIFSLEPDIAGRDENGGLVGWGELLKIREKAKVRTNDANAARSGRQDAKPDEGDGYGQGHTGDKCTGYWNRCIHSEDQPGELVKVLSAPSTMGGSSRMKGRPRSKSKSSSRLSLFLDLRGSKEKIRSEASSRHVARPRGDKGGCVSASDFF